MRKILLFLFVMCGFIGAGAQTFEYGGLRFKVTSKTTCSLLGMCEGNKLTEVTVPQALKYKGRKYTVTAVADGAFKYSDIEKVVLSDGIREIGASAFEMCQKLHYFTFGNSVEKIGERAFSCCSNCRSFSPLPATLKSIGERGFEKCFSAGELHVRCTEPPVCGTLAFYTPMPGASDASIRVPLFVPKGTAEKYRQSKGWNLFRNIVEE